MQRKLTLRLDDELIMRAKAYADEKGRSVSSLVADFFAMLEQDHDDPNRISPSVRRLLGVLKETDLDEADFRRHLEEKHG